MSWRYCIDSKEPRKSSERGQSPNFWQNFDRNNKRSRATVRRKILSAGLDYLLTLTTRENIVSFEQAAILFSRFIRFIRRYYPEWQYVAVAEQQSRGAYHWHLAVKGWQNIDMLRKCWMSVCGEGNIDVQAPKRHTGNSQWKQIRLALYLCKYITKELEMREDGEVVVGRHRYRASLGIEDPVERRILPIAAGPEAVATWLMEKTGVIGCKLMFEEGKAGWMCSWSFDT